MGNNLSFYSSCRSRTEPNCLAGSTFAKLLFPRVVSRETDVVYLEIEICRLRDINPQAETGFRDASLNHKTMIRVGHEYDVHGGGVDINLNKDRVPINVYKA